MRRRIERLEGQMIMRHVPVYRELTEPINEFGDSNPIIEIIKSEDGRLYRHLRLLSLGEIRRDRKLRSHPRLTEILENQEKYIERDERFRDMIFREWGPAILKRAVIIENRGRTFLQAELSFSRDPEARAACEEQLLFNIYNYRSTPFEAAAWAEIQLFNRYHPEVFAKIWEVLKAKILKEHDFKEDELELTEA